MFSKIFFFLIFLNIVLQCEFSQRKLFAGLQYKTKFPHIPLSELVEQLRRAPDDISRDLHVFLIMCVASYGDRLYDVYPDLSAECSMTIKAAFLVEATLATTVEAGKVIEDTIVAVSNDFKNATDVKEHPAELFCSRIKKAFAANSNLSASFEKAKKKAANLKNASSRSAYSPALLKSCDSILIQMFHSLDFPEYANIWARRSFRVLLTDQNISPTRVIIFAKSCHAVARKEQFADSMQKIYEKTMGDAVQALITLLKGIGKPEIIYWDPEYLWAQKMMKIFYGYVANDVILKKEVDSMAASMFPSASEEDLDFAKL